MQTCKNKLITYCKYIIRFIILFHLTVFFSQKTSLDAGIFCYLIHECNLGRFIISYTPLKLSKETYVLPASEWKTRASRSSFIIWYTSLELSVLVLVFPAFKLTAFSSWAERVAFLALKYVKFHPRFLMIFFSLAVHAIPSYYHWEYFFSVPPFVLAVQFQRFSLASF